MGATLAPLNVGSDVARVGEMRNAYNILVGISEGMRLLGRPERRWENNIRMDRREIGWGGVDWLHLVQDRDQWLTTR
jgi:hypothetical protein